MRKERIEEIKFRQEEREQELSAMGPLRAKMLLASEEGREEEYTETDPLLIPFPPLPPLKYLNIEDNAIDMHGKGGKFAPVVCMRLIRRWLEVSLVVTEIKLTGNLIGNAAGEEILTALEERQEAGLPSVKMTVTHCMEGETFRNIFKLASGANKKLSLIHI